MPGVSAEGSDLVAVVLQIADPVVAREIIETASLVLCYSRMLFFQAYPAFTRFTCKVFLTDALEYLSGAAATAATGSPRTPARTAPRPSTA